MAYLEQWKGTNGQAAWFSKVEQFDESITDQIKTMLPSLQMPVKLLWGEHDTWLTPDTAKKAQLAIPNSKLEFIEDAGHFSPEDNPHDVCKELSIFFNAS